MPGLHKVFITGRSALTASGNTADATWSALLQGTSHLAEITQWDLSTWSHRLGGEIKDYKPAAMLPDKKLMKVISKQDVLGINAAMQAIEHSQLLNYRETLPDCDTFNEKTGVFAGSPGNKYLQQYDFLPLLAKTHTMQDFAQHLFDEVHPTWLLRILPNNVLAYTGISYGFKGPNHNVTNHAVGGTQALIEAYHAIASGQIERAVVVAYDIGIEPQALFYYQQLGVLSEHHLKPFDASHDGTLLAEGAAALVLESEASMLAREATGYGEIMAGFSSSERAGLFSIEAEGEHLQGLLNQTLDSIGLQPKEVGLLVTHGNGNSKSDDSEALALGSLFGKTRIPTTAFKWSMGHTLCASGVLDTVLTSYALEQRLAPGIANLTNPAASAGDLNLAPSHQALNNSPYALLINRGFCSMNACLVMKACD